MQFFTDMFKKKHNQKRGNPPPPPFVFIAHNVFVFVNDVFFSIRYIIDGPGSMTVFNGVEEFVDELYTRSNTIMAGNLHLISIYLLNENKRKKVILLNTASSSFKKIEIAVLLSVVIANAVFVFFPQQTGMVSMITRPVSMATPGPLVTACVVMTSAAI